LADGINPNMSRFVKTLGVPIDNTKNQVIMNKTLISRGRRMASED
jgi:hypothetical protein